jgi:hypothetical protein
MRGAPGNGTGTKGGESDGVGSTGSIEVGSIGDEEGVESIREGGVGVSVAGTTAGRTVEGVIRLEILE